MYRKPKDCLRLDSGKSLDIPRKCNPRRPSRHRIYHQTFISRDVRDIKNDLMSIEVARNIATGIWKVCLWLETINYKWSVVATVPQPEVVGFPALMSAGTELCGKNHIRMPADRQSIAYTPPPMAFMPLPYVFVEAAHPAHPEFEVWATLQFVVETHDVWLWPVWEQVPPVWNE